MIKHLSFNNFKCLSGKKFDLDKVNVFTGYNGRGKSSVMQAILMLSQSIRKDDMNSLAHLHVNGDFVKLGDFDDLLTNPDTYTFSMHLILEDKEEKSHDVVLEYEMGDDFSVGVLKECLIDGLSYFDTSTSMVEEDPIGDNEDKGDLKLFPTYLNNQF